MTTAAVVLAALAYGIGSALIPVLNAEAYVAATALLLDGMDVVWMVVALSVGTVVGKEAEDLSRHDKWLCMMYPRLVLLKQFLAEDGAIFVSIDDV